MKQVIDGKNLDQLRRDDYTNVTHLEIENHENNHFKFIDYLKENASLKNIKNIEIKNALNLTDVSIPSGVELSISNPLREDTKKIEIHSTSEDGTSQTYTARGVPYFSALDGNVNSISWNGKVPFKNTNNTRWCRHFAIAYLIFMQKHANNEEARKAVEILQKRLGDKENIDESIPPEFEDYFNTLVKSSKENCIVGHSQWGDFFANLFSKMKNGERKHILVHIGDHAMAMECSVKINDTTGEKKYGMRLYDPNKTVTHLHIVANDITIKDDSENLSKIRNWRMSDFFSAKVANDYYGYSKESNNYIDQASHFVIVPDNFYQTYFKPPQIFKKRKTSFFLSTAEKENPVCFFYLLRAGLPLDNFINQLKLADPEKIVKILAAENCRGTTGLYMSLQNGDANAIKRFGGILKKIKLGPKPLAELLAAKNADGMPGLFMAMHDGHVGAIKNFGKILKQQKQKKNLTDDQIIELLQAKNKDGVSALSIALSIGQPEAIRCFREILKELKLTPKQIAGVVTSDNPNETHGLNNALIWGSAKAIGEFNKILNKAKLESQPLAELLVPKDNLLFVNPASGDRYHKKIPRRLKISATS